MVTPAGGGWDWVASTNIAYLLPLVIFIRSVQKLVKMFILVTFDN